MQCVFIKQNVTSKTIVPLNTTCHQQEKGLTNWQRSLRLGQVRGWGGGEELLLSHRQGTWLTLHLLIHGINTKSYYINDRLLQFKNEKKKYFVYLGN